MTLIIPDDILRAANLDERTVRIELACHLFDKEMLSLSHAARMADVEPAALEEELKNRGIPRFRYDAEDFREDMQMLDALKAQGR